MHINEKKKRQFLDCLLEGHTIGEAARICGVSRPQIYHHRRNDSEFKEAWERAYEEGSQVRLDIVESEIHRRAIDGVVKPVFYKGKKLRHKVLEYSDTLLIFYAKSLAPDKYRDNASVTHM